MTENRTHFEGAMVDLYDVFVDWPGRLSREMPGLTRRLSGVGARKVLDIGCGTGRHVHALTEAGFKAFGADASSQMIERARAIVAPGRLFIWALGERLPRELQEAAPFDAIVCLGNVWPHLVTNDQVRAAVTSMRDLLQPGGLAVVGFKAFAVQRRRRQPYLPLLKREHRGQPVFFVRWLDFAPRPAGDVDVCEMHISVLRGDASMATTCDVHEARRLRVWSAEGLARAFGAGFGEVRVSGSIGDPDAPATDENVFVHAVRR